MKQYLCLSDTPWRGVPGRTQQLMLRMKEARILFFEPAEGSKGHYKKPGRKVRPEITVYTLPPVFSISEKYTYLYERQQRRLASYIAGISARRRGDQPVIWCTSPEFVNLLDDIPHSGLIYDCCRDWSDLPVHWESELALQADLIFAASPCLAEHLAPCSDNIALLPNGANHTAFSKQGLPVPVELADLHGSILGYVGTVGRHLELLPVLRAAMDLPRCTFVFVGKVEENPLLRKLNSLPNVRFLGYRPALEIPEYVSQFSVCLNLLNRREQDEDIIPTRVYEYLSTGIPIVSMLFPDQIEDYPDVIYGAHSADEFSSLCSRAINETGDWARQRRRDYGAASSWSARAERVKEILSDLSLY